MTNKEIFTAEIIDNDISQKLSNLSFAFNGLSGDLFSKIRTKLLMY